MDDDAWIVVAIIAEERLCAQLVVDLVNNGFSVDDALGLVRFPHDI